MPTTVREKNTEETTTFEEAQTAMRSANIALNDLHSQIEEAENIMRRGGDTRWEAEAALIGFRQEEVRRLASATRAKRHYERARQAHLTERTAYHRALVRAKVDEFDAALQVATAANLQLRAAENAARQEGVNFEHLHWPELMPQSERADQKLSTWRRYCRKDGWLST